MGLLFLYFQCANCKSLIKLILLRVIWKRNNTVVLVYLNSRQSDCYWIDTYVYLQNVKRFEKHIQQHKGLVKVLDVSGLKTGGEG